MSIRQLAASAALFIALAGVACGDGESPLGETVDGDAQSSVHFDLSSRSGPLEACSEADEVGISVSPRGSISPGPRQAVGSALGPTPPCDAIFEVTIKKGQDARFTGEVFGAKRLLMSGSEPLPAARAKDGFEVRIQLEEIPALEVTTKTVGVDPVTGPTNIRYTFAVDGAPTPRIGIGATDMVPVKALAARPRVVDLDPRPCTVINGPAKRSDIPIPVPTQEVGEVTFELDCSGGAGLELVIAGSCGGVLINVSIDDGQPIPFPASGLIDASDLTAGRHKFELVGLTAQLGVTVSPDNPIFADIPAGGTTQVRFVVTCARIILPPPPPTSASLDVVLDEVSGVGIIFPINVLVDGVVEGTFATTTNINPTITLTGLSVGDHVVTLDPGTAGCTVLLRRPPAGTPIRVPGPRVVFVISCPSP